MKLTYEALLDDPTILERLMADARRERAETVGNALARIFHFPSFHAARPHLARQG